MSSSPSPQEGKRKRQTGSPGQSPKQRDSKSAKIESADPKASAEGPEDSGSTFAPIILAKSEDDAVFAEAVKEFITAEERRIKDLSGADVSDNYGKIVCGEAHTDWADAIGEYKLKKRREFLDASALMYLILLGKDDGSIRWVTEKGKDGKEVRSLKYEEETARAHITAVEVYFADLNLSVSQGDPQAKDTKTLLTTLHTFLHWRIVEMNAQHADDPYEEDIEGYECIQDRLLDYMLDCAYITSDVHADVKLIQERCRSLMVS